MYLFEYVSKKKPRHTSPSLLNFSTEYRIMSEMSLLFSLHLSVVQVVT